MVRKILSYICQGVVSQLHHTYIYNFIVLYLLEQAGQLEVRTSSTSLGDLQGETSHHQIPRSSSTGQVIKSSRLAESLKENNQQASSNSLGAELVMK